MTFSWAVILIEYIIINYDTAIPDLLGIKLLLPYIVIRFWMIEFTAYKVCVEEIRQLRSDVLHKISFRLINSIKKNIIDHQYTNFPIEY